MGRLGLLSGLILIILLGGLVFTSSGLVTLAIPLVIYILFSLISAPEKIEVTAIQTVNVPHAAPGAAIPVHLKINNQGPRLEEILLLLHTGTQLRRASGEISYYLSLAPGVTFETDYQVRGPRGYHLLPEIEMIAKDPFGLFPIRSSIPQEGQAIILPVPLILHRMPIRPSQTRGFAGPVPSRMAGAGTDFQDVREYLPGDPLRRVNWRVVARHEEHLFTNQFEMERITDVGIIVDARQQSNAFGRGGSLFEQSILAAASLSDLFLKDGNRVGLLIYGFGLDWVFPGYGKQQKHRILHALAKAEPGHNYSMENLNNLPVRLFPAHSQIILISPLLPSDSATLMRLRSQGYEILVVSPDPVAFELKFLSTPHHLEQAVRIAHIERRLILKRIRQAGVNVLDWDISQPFDRVVRTALIRSWVRLNLPEKH